jgi:hypothetical protein
MWLPTLQRNVSLPTSTLKVEVIFSFGTFLQDCIASQPTTPQLTFVCFDSCSALDDYVLFYVFFIPPVLTG